MLGTEIDNSQLRIFNFLQLHDGDFSPTLSKRVDLKEYSNKLSNNGCNVFLVAEKDFGHACFYLDSSNKTAFLSSICIDQYLIGKGISMKFLYSIESLAQKKGAIKMELEVSLFDERAKGFYKKSGYLCSQDFHRKDSSVAMYKVFT